MSKAKLRITDLHHRVSTPMPASEEIFYQCLRCWDIVPSMPPDNLYCSCRNVSVDIDAGRAGAKDESLLRVLQIVRSSK